MESFHEQGTVVKLPTNLKEYTVFSESQSTETVQDKPTLVSKYLRYGDLFDFMDAHKTLISDEKLIKYLFLQVCSGLHALHTEVKKAHLDIKLENVLVGDDGTLKLCDFGMVQSVDSELNSRQGTDYYMAPEVRNSSSTSKTYKGMPADIFSMGVFLWILKFKMPPFNSTSRTDKNYYFLQENSEDFWRLHPAIREYVGSIDDNFK